MLTDVTCRRRVVRVVGSALPACGQLRRRGDVRRPELPPRLEQLLRRREARAGIADERLVDERVKPDGRRHARAVAQPCRAVLELARQDRHLARPVVREASAHHLEDEHAERIEIGSVIDLRRTTDLLGRHVRDRPDRLARAGQVLAVDRVRLADAEVEDHGTRAPPLRRQEHVARLDVAMHDARSVRVDQTAQDVLADLDHLAPRQRALVSHALRERLTDEALHDQEHLAVVRVRDLDDARNVLAANARGGLGLATEARHQGLVEHDPADDLDRHGRRWPREVGRGKHVPHSASTDQRVDAVFVAENVARFDRQGSPAVYHSPTYGPIPRSSRFRTFPVGFRGRCSMNT